MATKKSSHSKKRSARKVAAKRRAPVATLKAPRLGQYWPGQGGVVFAIARGENGKPDTWLIAASDKSGKLKQLRSSYGCYGTEIKTARSYRDGAANTAALLKADSPLAKACTAVEADGHKDFFAPAQCQINMLRANLPDKIKDVGWVLSSTEYSAYYAWSQPFGVGTQYVDDKVNECSVFPVRQVPVSH